MKTTNNPIPEQPTQPEEQPTPEVRPRRRPFVQPVFTGRVRRITSKVLSAAALLLITFGAQAQTQPVPDPPSSPGVPQQPMNPDSPREPRTPPQQPTTPQAPGHDGWIMFDDRVGSDLGLEPDMMQRLRDVDGRYEKDYRGLGNAPSKNPAYRDLSDRRNADVKAILTPAQYDRWMRMSTATGQTKPDAHDMDGGKKPQMQSSPRTPAPATTPMQKTTPAPSTPKPTKR